MNVNLLPVQPIAPPTNALTLIVKPIVYLIVGIALAIFAGMAIGMAMKALVRRWRIAHPLPHHPAILNPVANQQFIHNQVEVIPLEEPIGSFQGDRLFRLEFHGPEFQDDVRDGRYELTLREGEESVMVAEQFESLHRIFLQHGFNPNLRVQYVSAEGIPHISSDEGGLTRQYITNFFRAFRNDKTQHQSDFILHNGRLMPQKSSSVNAISYCYLVGEVMEYLRRKRELIGPIFHEAAFEGILVGILTLEDEKQHNFSELSTFAKLRMCDRMVNSLIKSGEDLNYLLPVLELLAGGLKASQRRILAVADYYQNFGGDDRFLLSDGGLNLEEIQKDKQGFLDSCFNSLMAQKTSSSLGVVEHALRGTFDIACAMYIHGFRLDLIRRHSDGSKVTLKRMMNAIQGSIDRQIISDKILCSENCDAIVRQKVDWLKKWILRPETTEAQIENLLLYWTGSTVVDDSVDRKLNIAPQVIIYHPGTNEIKLSFQPTPSSNTCIKTLYFAPEYFKDDIAGDGQPCSGLNDSTESGFYHIIDLLTTSENENKWTLL